MVAFRLSVGRYACACQPGRHTADASARAAWGCDRPADHPVFPDPLTGSFHVSATFDLRRCPADQVGPEWSSLIAAWSVFGGGDTHGPLPLAGGWLDQMQWFADAHSVLSSERSKYLEARQKDVEAKQKGRRANG